MMWSRKGAKRLSSVPGMELLLKWVLSLYTHIVTKISDRNNDFLAPIKRLAGGCRGRG